MGNDRMVPPTGGNVIPYALLWTEQTAPLEVLRSLFQGGSDRHGLAVGKPTRYIPPTHSLPNNPSGVSIAWWTEVVRTCLSQSRGFIPAAGHSPAKSCVPIKMTMGWRRVTRRLPNPPPSTLSCSPGSLLTRDGEVRTKGGPWIEPRKSKGETK